MTITKKYNVMVGSDPELLLQKEKGGRKKYFPIIGRLGYSKGNPLKIDDTGYRTLQEDNVALEFTTHPVSTLMELKREMDFMLKYSENFLEKFEIQITKFPQVNFEQTMLRSKQAMTFGCEPSYNAYKRKENAPPVPHKTLRTAGGHVHISYDGVSEKMSEDLVMLLDYVYLHKIDEIETDLKRHAVYGVAGEMRHKSYGFEWRVPNNEWIFSPDKIKKMWDVIKGAFEMYDKGYRIQQSTKTYMKIQSMLVSKEAGYIRTRNLDTFKKEYLITPKKAVAA